MRRRITSLPMVLTFVVSLVASTILVGCPARRSGSPADLEPAFLDRA